MKGLAMRLEQWSHIRNAIKEQRNEVARDLDKMESSANSYDGVISNFPKYDQAVKLWMDYDQIVNHMDNDFTVSQIENIDY
jgi:hypothetical protein